MNDNLAYDDLPPQPFNRFTCHTCGIEITSATMHGWVRSGFGPETGWRTQLEPCPTCSTPAQASRINAQVDRLLGQSRIPLRMAEWQFSSLPYDIDANAKAKAVFFSSGNTQKHGIYFHGAVGQGKTGLAISIIQAVMRRGEDAIFIRSLDLMDRLRESIHRGTHEGDEILHLAKTIKWLALDDLAVEKPTEYVIQELKAIVDARFDNDLYTIVTSNFSLKELEAYWRPPDVKEGAFYPGRRVVDRLAEYAEGVRVSGRNLRLVKEMTNGRTTL